MSFESVPVVKIGGYHYFIHPLSDGVPSISRQILEDAASCASALLPDSETYDIIVTAEAMGIPISTALSIRTGKPYSIFRKRRYGLEGEIQIDQSTGYSKGELFLCPVGESPRVVFVDDVLSTGGTIQGIIEGLRRGGFEVMSAVILFDKMRPKERRDLEMKLDCPIRAVLEVEVVNGICQVRASRDIEELESKFSNPTSL